MKKFTALVLVAITLLLCACATVGAPGHTSEAFSPTPTVDASTPSPSPTPTPTEEASPTPVLCEHKYDKTSCLDTKTCTLCGNTLPASEHTFSSAKCTVCGDLDTAVYPKMCFTGDISGMTTKADERDIKIDFYYGEKSFSGFAEIKIQGNSSLRYEKKNYTIKLFKDEKHDEKLKVDVGWGKENKYCLKANWIDKTHSRNIISARIASAAQKKYNLLPDAPNNGNVDGFPIEIYANGEFLGIYTFNIPKDEWTFNMDSDNPNHIVFCGEGWDAANLFKAMPDFSTWALEVGEENSTTLNKFKALFDFVMNSSDTEFKENFSKHINLDAALNYYILADFFYLVDNRGKNMLFATYDGELWYPILYDMDTSWGVNYQGTGKLPYKTELINIEANLLFERINKCFPEKLAARYDELRQDLLKKENVMHMFAAFNQAIHPDSFAREKNRWGALPGYSISQIEEYIDAIAPKLDAKYAALKN